MRQGKCDGCGVPSSLGSCFMVNDKNYCEPCADKLVGQLKAEKKPMQVSRTVDPTICAQCHADNGNTEFERVGKLSFCQTCSTLVYERPFPEWLKLSLVGLLILLGSALIHGIPYFKAGKSLVIAERLLDTHQYGKAVPPLEKVLAAAPDSEKAILLTAKAYLLSGNPEKAQRLFAKHSHFENGELTSEVTGIWNRVLKASEKANMARKLDGEKKWEEAAKAMHEAAALYPELPVFGFSAGAEDAAVAFERQDYDKFVELSDGLWKLNPTSTQSAGMLSSALACKYAVTGDPELRKRSEELLEKSRLLAQSSPDATKAYEEYSERIRYRLDSRVIIDTEDYNRRFRPNLNKPEKGN